MKVISIWKVSDICSYGYVVIIKTDIWTKPRFFSGDTGKVNTIFWNSKIT